PIAGVRVEVAAVPGEAHLSTLVRGDVTHAREVRFGMSELPEAIDVLPEDPAVGEVAGVLPEGEHAVVAVRDDHGDELVTGGGRHGVAAEGPLRDHAPA